jgi:phospholipid N-methyltransferase
MSNGLFEFIRAAVKDPRKVSTPFPTLKFLAQALIKHSTLSQDHNIVELGCGTGAITKHILDAGPYDSYVGVEISSSMIDFLQRSYPDNTFIKASADNLDGYIESNSVDVVISSLPWTMFSGVVQEAIIEEIMRILKPGGHFVTFICLHALPLPGAARAQKLFKSHFSQFEYCESITRNLPPANIYRGIK